ncbi:MAG: zinc ribbon domain-containing protein [Candidatus Desulforudis sp.]|nr:zinc ribbon domain-containing protein [Desulforudis sp.]
MPIFEFRCLECGNLFEKLFRNNEEKVAVACPECRSESFERVISRSNHQLGTVKGGKKPKLTTKSCSPGNTCATIEIPGPSR